MWHGTIFYIGGVGVTLKGEQISAQHFLSARVFWVRVLRVWVLGWRSLGREGRGKEERERVRG